jgi:hypothetical protein
MRRSRESRSDYGLARSDTCDAEGHESVPTSKRPSYCPLPRAGCGYESGHCGGRDRDESDEQRHLGSGIVAPRVATGDSGRAELTDDVVSGVALARDGGGGDRRRGEDGLAGKGLSEDHQCDHGKQAPTLRHGTGGVGDPAAHHDGRIVTSTTSSDLRRFATEDARSRPSRAPSYALRFAIPPRAGTGYARGLPIDHAVALASPCDDGLLWAGSRAGGGVVPVAR